MRYAALPIPTPSESEQRDILIEAIDCAHRRWLKCCVIWNRACKLEHLNNKRTAAAMYEAVQRHWKIYQDLLTKLNQLT
jgi:hypothetical protein